LFGFAQDVIATKHLPHHKDYLANKPLAALTSPP
jgi:hypothetical protein